MSETVKLLKEVYEALAEIAKKQGKSIEEIIMDSVEKRLNPKTRIEIYKKLYEKHFREAEEFYAKGDILQSGEKYLGRPNLAPKRDRREGKFAALHP